jgi:hypothetical protein
MAKSDKRYAYIEGCIWTAAKHNGPSDLQSLMSAANLETRQLANLSPPDFKYVRHFIKLTDRLYQAKLKERK